MPAPPRARRKKRGAVTPGKELSNKEYDRQLKKLHVELVKLQQWVVHKGLKVCIVFEGRDGADKGGTNAVRCSQVMASTVQCDCVISLPSPDPGSPQVRIRREKSAAPSAARARALTWDRSCNSGNDKPIVSSRPCSYRYSGT